MIDDRPAVQRAADKTLRRVGRPRVSDLPAPPPGRTGWPWTVGSEVRPWTEATSLPTVTIVTPSFNQGAYIEETIRSVLLQDYPNLEFMVLDGGSSDETLSIIEKYKDWISVWRSEPDDGQTAAIAEGFALASGTILNWLNSDDSLLPNALHAIAEMYNLAPEADVFTGVRLQMTRDGFSFYAQLTWTEEWHNYLMGRADFPQEVTFFTRAAYDRAGGVDRSYSFMFDVVLFNEILQVATVIACTRMPLGCFRVYPEMKTLRPSMQKEMERDKYAASNRPGYIQRKMHSFLTRTHLSRPVYNWLNRMYMRKTIKEIYFDVSSSTWSVAPVGD